MQVRAKLTRSSKTARKISSFGGVALSPWVLICWCVVATAVVAVATKLAGNSTCLTRTLCRKRLHFTRIVFQVYAERRQNAHEAVFPVLMEILPEHVFHNHKPIILGCEIKQGMLKVGTPICAMFDKTESDAKQVQFLCKFDRHSIESSDLELDVRWCVNNLTLNFGWDNLILSTSVLLCFQDALDLPVNERWRWLNGSECVAGFPLCT